jgi:hypothetical protein
MASQGPAARSAISDFEAPHLLAAGIFQPELYMVSQPISRMLSDVMSTFYHVQVPEKLGMVFKMHATMRVRFSRHDPEVLAGANAM